jgi:tyrosine-specific transport protein
MKKEYIFGILLYTGTMVGAGILGLPYALAQSGFFGGAIILLIGVFFAYLTVTYVGRLVYMETTEAPLVAIFRKHLGTKLGYVAFAGILISSYGAMIAYPLAIGTMFNSLFGIPNWVGVIVFIAIITFLLSRNLGQSNTLNSIITIILIVLLIWALIKSVPAMEGKNLLFFYPSNILDAWGIVIFTLAGHIVIPTVLYYVKTEMKQGLRVIRIGLFLVVGLYFLFFIVAVGVMGENVTPVATTGLGDMVSTTVSVLGQAFAILALFTSAFGIGLSLKYTIRDTFKLKPYPSLAIMIAPLLVIDIILSINNGDAFIEVLNYAGGIGSAMYVGVIPALIIIRLAKFYDFPLGRKGAIACLMFFGMAILYTIVFR